MVAVVELEFKGGKRRRIGSFTRKGGLCREGLKRAAVDAKLNCYRNVSQDYRIVPNLRPRAPFKSNCNI